MNNNTNIDDNTNTVDTTPLLAQSDTSEAAAYARTVVQRTALGVGFSVGVFVQISTLFAIHLSTKSLYDESSSPVAILLFSMLWSSLNSLLALVVLRCLRSLLHYDLLDLEDQENKTLASSECLTLLLESRYIMGSLTGVCIGWSVTDLCMGLMKQSVWSLVALVVSLVWCDCLLRYFTSKQNQQNVASEEPSSTIVQTV